VVHNEMIDSYNHNTRKHLAMAATEASAEWDIPKYNFDTLEKPEAVTPERPAHRRNRQPDAEEGPVSGNGDLITSAAQPGSDRPPKRNRRMSCRYRPVIRVKIS